MEAELPSSPLPAMVDIHWAWEMEQKERLPKNGSLHKDNIGFDFWAKVWFPMIKGRSSTALDHYHKK